MTVLPLLPLTSHGYLSTLPLFYGLGLCFNRWLILLGALAPMGFFDPLGLSSDKTDGEMKKIREGANKNPEDLISPSWFDQFIATLRLF